METNDLAPKLKSVSLFLQEEPHVGRKKLYELLQKGKIPCFRLGRKILVNTEEVLASIRQSDSGEKN